MLLINLPYWQDGINTLYLKYSFLELVQLNASGKVIQEGLTMLANDAVEGVNGRAMEQFFD